MVSPSITRITSPSSANDTIYKKPLADIELFLPAPQYTHNKHLVTVLQRSITIRVLLIHHVCSQEADQASHRQAGSLYVCQI